jgi:hypothetical protein
MSFESTARPVWTSSEPDGPLPLGGLPALDAPLQPAKAREIETAAAAIAKRDFIVVPHVNELVGSLDAEVNPTSSTDRDFAFDQVPRKSTPVDPVDQERHFS